MGGKSMAGGKSIKHYDDEWRMKTMNFTKPFSIY